MLATITSEGGIEAQFGRLSGVASLPLLSVLLNCPLQARAPPPTVTVSTRAPSPVHAPLKLVSNKTCLASQGETCAPSGKAGADAQQPREDVSTLLRGVGVDACPAGSEVNSSSICGSPTTASAPSVTSRAPKTPAVADAQSRATSPKAAPSASMMIATATTSTASAHSVPVPSVVDVPTPLGQGAESSSGCVDGIEVESGEAGLAPPSKGDGISSCQVSRL